MSGSVVRKVRLEGLGDAPYAFHSKLEDAQTLPDEEWQTRTRNGAEGILSVCALATDGEKTVGIAAGFPHDTSDDLAHLVSMWVHEAYRGTAVATELVDFIASWATGRGAKGLLAGVTSGNDRALRFYSKVGFQPYDGNVDPEVDGCETVLWKRLD